MKITKKDLYKIIDKEIKWSKENRKGFNISQDWIDGFINGLKQTKKILKEYIQLTN